MTFEPLTLKISAIRRDCGTQTRIKLDERTVQEYMEEMKTEKFPPIVVVQTSEGYILADGFHRCEAAERLHGRDADIITLCKQGTKRDALLYALGANNKHGLRRTNEDKRNTVLLAVHDEELKRESNRSLARICGVSEFLVRSIRDGRDDQETCDKIAPPPSPVHGEPAAPQCRTCGTTESREWIGHDGRWLCQQCYMAQALPPAAPPARNQRQHILNMIEGIRAYIGGDGIRILTQQEFNRRLGVILDVIEGYIGQHK